MHSAAPVLTAAREANITHRACDVVSLSAQIELRDEHDLLRISSKIGHPHLHRALSARFSTEEVDYRMGAIIAEVESRGLSLSWVVGSFTVRPGLGGHREKVGLMHITDETGMGLDQP